MGNKFLTRDQVYLLPFTSILLIAASAERDGYSRAHPFFALWVEMARLAAATLNVPTHALALRHINRPRAGIGFVYRDGTFWAFSILTGGALFLSGFLSSANPMAAIPNIATAAAGVSLDLDPL
jgi:hypothetical protein